MNLIPKNETGQFSKILCQVCLLTSLPAQLLISMALSKVFLVRTEKRRWDQNQKVYYRKTVITTMFCTINLRTLKGRQGKFPKITCDFGTLNSIGFVMF